MKTSVLLLTQEHTNKEKGREGGENGWEVGWGKAEERKKIREKENCRKSFASFIFSYKSVQFFYILGVYLCLKSGLECPCVCGCVCCYLLGLPCSDAIGSDRFSLAPLGIHSLRAHLASRGLRSYLLWRTKGSSYEVTKWKRTTRPLQLHWTRYKKLSFYSAFYLLIYLTIIVQNWRFNLLWMLCWFHPICEVLPVWWVLWTPHRPRKIRRLPDLPIRLVVRKDLQER